ncbi:hypothetical protein [Acinetobacter sp. TSRC1-2]
MGNFKLKFFAYFTEEAAKRALSKSESFNALAGIVLITVKALTVFRAY